MTKHQTLKNSNGTIRLFVSDVGIRRKGTLVCVHGGPGGDHRGNEGIFDEIAGYCGPMGFSIVQFDMYGAGNSEGKPADITLKTQLVDYSSVLNFVREKLPGSIHVVGESMGATIAALNWQTYVLSHLLLWPAFDLKDTDLKPYLDPKWASTLQTKGYIEDNGMVVGREFLDEVKTTDFSRCFRLPQSPTLLVHGRRDVAVPFQQSLDAVSRSAGECVLFANPTGDHGLQQAEERRFTHSAIKWWLSNR